MTRTFDCPKCGAPVQFQPDSIQSPGGIHCSYCNSLLSLPDEAHGQPARVISQVQIRVGGPASFKFPKWLMLIFLIPICVVVASVFGALAPLAHLFTRNTPISSPTPRAGGDGNRKDNAGGFANEVMTFGSEGIGPGMFSDARSIAVDNKGDIYVADYTGGRVQAFDSSGKFITQWTVDPKTPLRGLAADRKGNIFITQAGNIARYDGATGKLLGQLEYKDGWGFDDITATPDGGLICSWYKNRDDIVHFDASGQVVITIRAAISTASGDSELNTRVASDGVGNIYALGTFNDAVFKFSSAGKFINRFGGRGDKPGQFSAASAIAVDGKGRVFVSDSKGVQVFDADGRYINIFKPPGHAFGMVFNDQNELFIAARTQVIKYAPVQ